jgi:hypothetical protein
LNPQSLRACWLLLKGAKNNQVLVLAGGGAFQLLSAESEEAKKYLADELGRVIGVYSPGYALADLLEDARAAGAAV